MRLPLPILLLCALSCNGDKGQPIESPPIDSTDSVIVDEDGDGSPASEDCDDNNSSISPDQEELCDGLDNNCDGETDVGASDALAWYSDGDADGYGVDELLSCTQPNGYAPEAGDCDDSNPLFHPGAEETDCTDPNDYNCDSSVGYADDDGDGYAACEECDDGLAEINPAQEEVCDEVDNNCDGSTDEGVTQTYYQDSDSDGYGDADYPVEACSEPEGYSSSADDCDDSAGGINPGAAEVCDELDTNCDSLTDEAVTQTFYQDLDGDGYGDAETTVQACSVPVGYSDSADDCDDGAAAIHPDAAEVCDDIDNDCDSLIDDNDSDLDLSSASTWYTDKDKDGYGNPGSSSVSCVAPGDGVADSTDCDDGDALISPSGTEICDSIDNDCDMTIDDADPSLDLGSAATWYADSDGDSYGDGSDSALACLQPSGRVSDSKDCDDSDSAISPSATEICDNIDNDCDSQIDDADGSLDLSSAGSWYDDGDGDGYGYGAGLTQSCIQPSGTVTDSSDCNDSNGKVYPGATEICDKIDNDCDSFADDADSSLDLSTATTWYADSDGDTYGNASSTKLACSQPSATVTNDDDCDDTSSAIRPGATETCDGKDNDCSGDADTEVIGDGAACAAESCYEIHVSRPSAGNGTYYVDPSGSSSLTVLCEMTIDGGGWTQARSGYLSGLKSGVSRKYLYSYSTAWYESPATTTIWSWSSYSALSGTYSYGSKGSTSATGSFSCSHAESGHWGVGCSNGGGSTYKTLPIYAKDADQGKSTICQDRPDVYGVGACASGAQIWVRP